MTDTVQDTTAAPVPSGDAAAVDAAAAPATTGTAAGTTDPAMQAAIAATIPESYTLALPSDSVLAADVTARVTEVAKAIKLTSDADAQALVGLVDAEAREVIKTYEAARAPGGELHKAMVAQFAEAALQHPKLGNGDAAELEHKQLRAGLVLNRFGRASGLAAVIKERGYLRPEELVFLNDIADALGEQPAVMPSGPRAPDKGDLAQRMYGKLATTAT